MRLKITCSSCGSGKGAPRYSVDLPDTLELDFTCPRGHRHIRLLDEQKYEVLVDFALLAILDGYHREAVSNLAAAVERYYEFWLRVAAVRRGLSGREFDKAWKLIANQSERQLGAFIMLYAAELGITPSMFPENRVAFRNKVVHKDYLPTQAEVLDYTEYVLSYLRELTLQLRHLGLGSIVTLHAEQVKKAEAKLTSRNSWVETIQLRTMLRSRAPLSIKEALTKMKRLRRSLYEA